MNKVNNNTSTATKKELKPFAQEIRNMMEYSIAKENLKSLDMQIGQLAIDHEGYDDDAWQKKMEELEEFKSLQEKLIDQYCSSQPEYDSKYLGNNLKRLLKKYGMKISELEELLRVSPGYLSRTLSEDSKKRLSIDAVWRISKVFSVNIDELVNSDFCKPSKAILPVYDFIQKLKDDTEKENFRWRNLGMQPTEASELLFNTLVKADGTQIPMYGPLNYADATRGLSLRGEIYSVSINDSLLLMVPVEEISYQVRGVEFYTVSYWVNPYGGREMNLNRLCCTLDDNTDILNEKAEELLNMVKLHEADFIVSESARSFIDSYLNSAGV